MNICGAYTVCEVQDTKLNKTLLFAFSSYSLGRQKYKKINHTASSVGGIAKDKDGKIDWSQIMEDFKQFSFLERLSDSNIAGTHICDS